MTETMWKILDILRQGYLQNDGYYRSVWSLSDELNTALAGCGVPTGDPAIEQLVNLGLIEELPDLGYRYRIIVKAAEEAVSDG